MILTNTKRLTFGRYSEYDLEYLFELNGDSDVMKYITLGRPMTIEEVKNKSIPKIMKAYTHGPDFGIFPAFLINDYQYIGSFQFEPDYEIKNVIEIGWRLKKSFGQKINHILVYLMYYMN